MNSYETSYEFAQVSMAYRQERAEEQRWQNQVCNPTDLYLWRRVCRNCGNLLVRTGEYLQTVARLPQSKRFGQIVFD
jgi:hypothetical protein